MLRLQSNGQLRAYQTDYEQGLGNVFEPTVSQISLRQIEGFKIKPRA